MTIIEKVKSYCTNILEGNICKKLPYHNLLHTKRVVDSAKKIIQYLQIPDEDAEIIIISAWFHDIGFCETYYGHEDESIRLANQYLKDLGYETDKIALVLSCIEATKIPQNPKNILGEILCDSDLHHLGSTNYFSYNRLLRTEWSNECDKSFTDLEWYRLNKDFLENHKYFTQYGQQELKKVKLLNIEKLKLLFQDL